MTYSSFENTIFGDLIRQGKFREASKCAILDGRNKDVNEINNNILNLLDEKTEMIFSSIDSTENCDKNNSNQKILPEYLNALDPSSLPPHEL